MDTLAALAAGQTPADVSLDGYPLGYVRTTAAWDTGTRTLKEHLFYLVDRGQLLISTENKPVVLRPGWMALIPPGTPFRATAGSPPPRFWRLRLRLPVAWGKVHIQAGGHELEAVVARLVSEATQAAHPLRNIAVRGGLMVLLAALRRGAADDAAGGLTPTQQRLLERFADDHPQATPRDLMRQLDLTHDYASRQFTRSFGRPPRQWLLEQRMHHAATRVAEGDEPIVRIAEDLGYVDVRLFVRQFRAVLGQPPGRFRKQVRNPEG